MLVAGWLAGCGGDDAPDPPVDAGADSAVVPERDSGGIADAGPSDAPPPDADAGGGFCASPAPAADGGVCPAGATFCNEAAAAGLWAAGPAYGRGAAWVDVDGDGWEDLWQSDSGGRTPEHPRLSVVWRNCGGLRFAPMDLGIDPDHLAFNWMGVWQDYDADGDPDLLLANGGYSGVAPPALYRNDLATDGRFTEVTAEAGLLTEPAGWWSGAYADFDGDTDLDLVMTRVQGPPALYESLGDGTFAEVSGALPVPGDEDTDHKNPLWFDYDADGDPDLFLASRSDARIFRNDGASGFTDMTASILDPLAVRREVFSAAAADLDQDGDDDLYLGRWDQQDYILLNEGAAGFRRLGPEVGLDMTSGKLSPENTMALSVGDLDADGFPEVMIGPGRPEEAYHAIVLCNQGTPLSFRRCSGDVVAGHGFSRNHAIVLADPDHDGDVDFFWNLGGEVSFRDRIEEDSRALPALYVQRGATPRTVIVRLQGADSNRDAVGARIRIDGGARRWAAVRSAQGFPGQHSEWQVLSLSGAETGELTVYWPSGGVTTRSVTAGERIEIAE